MGNAESSSSREENAKSPAPASVKYSILERQASREAKRKQQSHASTKPSAPASTLVPSSAASTTTTREHASPTQTHSRARSITSATSRSKDTDDSASSHRSNRSAMGQAESKERRPPSRSQTLPAPPVDDDRVSTSSPSSRPVDVPQAGDGLSEKEIFEPTGIPQGSPYSAPTTNRYDRPPRLPLPIEEELHTPGSPILTAQDVSSPLYQSEVDGLLPRRSSVLSSTTADDDEIGDLDAFMPESHSSAPSVPTTVTWRGDSDKVYVTGTFVNWERKFKLHQDKEHGGFTATLQLKPGTHHLKFLVGGDMVTSDDLPTTVDYTNILVNYIEVVAPLPATAEQAPVPAEPMPIPGAALTAGQATETGEAIARPMDIRPAQRGSETVEGGQPSTLQETVGAGPAQPTSIPQAPEPLPTPTPRTQPVPKPVKQKLPRPKYTSEIPRFLYDLDSNNTEDEKVQRAKRVEQHLPQPPSLPMFLGKSILNGNMPHKDDASVLLMPNHTVLNHLATSSIKSGVLATSGTTRYKRKFLTTIMYKPTADD
ncbi:galactose metabolism- protein [Recurvomyces mirabilis]|nr:galactose metabolism- protein [Recurvomyces mirabilis]